MTLIAVKEAVKEKQVIRRRLPAATAPLRRTADVIC